jgi:hypothetical protein
MEKKARKQNATAKPITKQEWGRPCQECRAKAYGPRIGSWLVYDEVWKAAGYKKTDIACKSCLTKRLRKRFNLKERSHWAVICSAHAFLTEL